MEDTFGILNTGKIQDSVEGKNGREINYSKVVKEISMVIMI